MRVAIHLALLLVSPSVAKPWVSTSSNQLLPRHGDDEHGGGMDDAPLKYLDEAEILAHHDPDPISYYQYDFESAQPELTPDEAARIQTDVRHGSLMMLHAFAMTTSFLMVLPIHIVLSSARHRLLWLSQTLFWALNLIGWAAGRAYRRRTPTMYQGSTHSTTGGILLLIAVVITAFDLVPAFRSLGKELHDLGIGYRVEWPRWMPRIPSWRIWSPKAATEETEYLPVTHSPEMMARPSEELTPVNDEWKEGDGDEIDMLGSHQPPTYRPRAPIFSSSPSPSVEIKSERSHLLHRHSIGSDHSTLHEERHLSPVHRPRDTVLSQVYKIAGLIRVIVERSLVVYGWGQALQGLVIYVGFGRAQYINGVLAHFIKGSIFWWYGILTFARYLGAWRRWGWAWNAIPEHTGSQPISASTVESLVIFLYGFTQQFMERLGKHPGDPYTAKDIEHISIAVMFWGGGLVGMAVESSTVRRWLLGETEETEEKASATHGKRGKASTSTSMSSPIATRWTAANPLPAVAIGITGIAMSAHHQTYLFQVQIHALWGYLLLGFAVCRSLTCFFDWVRPRQSKTIAPALPPTELIGSIFLGAGGFTFICSTEQITFWAMRTHRDDMMMFLNLAIAFTCVAYVWVTIVLVVAGRAQPKHRLHV